MIYKEEHRDLFSVPKDYALCHCISSDFALGAGIAKEFAKRGVKAELMKTYVSNDWTGVGYSAITFSTDFVLEFNLITKRKYWQKPTLMTVRQALESAKVTIDFLALKKIAMPKIGCGLDKLKWEDVSEIIKDVFKDTDVEILVCIK